MEGLKEGQEYSYYAFAENNDGRSSQQIETFEFTPNNDPIVEPKVETREEGEVTETTAVLKGKIINNGNSEIKEYGVYISQTEGFADGAGDDVLKTDDAIGNYSITETGLDPDT